MTGNSPSQLSFEDILESLAEGVIAVGPDMRVSVFNQSAEKMTELSRSLALGRPLDACLKRNTRIVELLRETMDKGRIFAEYEDKLWRRITGDSLPVSVTTSLVFDPEGDLRGAVALLKDLSGIRPLEASALRKERLAYIGAFAANLAHEIRNPLSGIRGAAQLLSRKAADKSLAEYMNVIIKEADRLNGILNDMLDFSRPARLVKKPVNIHQVLDSVVLLLGGGTGKTAFVKSYDPSIPEVAGDESQLKQVFLNLVKNAIEAMTEGGIVSVSTRVITEFHMGEGGPGRMVSIEVRDTGCGIRPEDLENVFTPFFTSKPSGSGLGMAITLKIIKEHGGHLKIDSEPGEGTSVLVYLPVEDRGA